MTKDPDERKPMGYIEQEVARFRQSPPFHTSECLNNSVQAFVDDKPEPGCICGASRRP